MVWHGACPTLRCFSTTPRARFNPECSVTSYPVCRRFTGDFHLRGSGEPYSGRASARMIHTTMPNILVHSSVAARRWVVWEGISTRIAHKHEAGLAVHRSYVMSAEIGCPRHLRAASLSLSANHANAVSDREHDDLDRGVFSACTSARELCTEAEMHVPHRAVERVDSESQVAVRWIRHPRRGLKRDVIREDAAVLGQEAAVDDFLEIVDVVALVGVDKDLIISSGSERGCPYCNRRKDSGFERRTISNVAPSRARVSSEASASPMRTSILWATLACSKNGVLISFR